MSSVFRQYRPKSTYLPLGNRRVYTCTDNLWMNKWRDWELNHGSVGDNGQALTCYRPRESGRQSRIYYDTSLVDMDLSRIEAIQPFDPTNTKYMCNRYLGGKSLYECSHMATHDFERLVGSLGKDKVKCTNSGKRLR